MASVEKQALGMPSLSIFANEPNAESYPAGHKFFSTGDHGDLMYVLVEGEVDIVLRGHVLERVTPGGIFGELALIDHRERSADAIAVTDVKVTTLDQKRFLYLVRNHPYFAVEVMTIMANGCGHSTASWQPNKSNRARRSPLPPSSADIKTPQETPVSLGAMHQRVKGRAETGPWSAGPPRAGSNALGYPAC